MLIFLLAHSKLSSLISLTTKFHFLFNEHAINAYMQLHPHPISNPVARSGF
jgi:hypothetical protein